MSITKRLRYEVLRRDDHKCRYCGADATDSKPTVDHVVPVALGGSDEPDNLVTACVDCNAGKSSVAPDSPIVENVADDALRWAAAMERAAQIQAGDRDTQKEYVAAIDAAWREWGTDEYDFDRPFDWRTSCEQFHRAGLTVDEVSDAIDIAMRSRVPEKRIWLYMCGVCWRLIRERQEIAQGLLASEDEAGADGEDS